MAKCKTIISKLEEVTTPAIARFIVYYYTAEDRRKPWDEFKTCHELIKGRTYDECLDWLTREDAQLAIQIYHKHMKLYNLSLLYDKMLAQAMEGNINAAKWVESFSNSEYFDDSTDDIDSFLNGVNIPSLKKE